MVAKVRKSKASAAKSTKKASKKATKKTSSSSKKPAKKKKEAAVDEKTSQTDAVTKPQPYQPAKNEEYMNERQREHFKKILEAWKRDIMEEVDETIREMKESTVPADPNDRATQEEEFTLELRARDRERKLLKKIEDALQDIEDKDYGYCENCGVEIGIRRLEARPTATLCIDCKTLAEIREKRSSM